VRLLYGRLCGARAWDFLVWLRGVGAAIRYRFAPCERCDAIIGSCVDLGDFFDELPRFAV